MLWRVGSGGGGLHGKRLKREDCSHTKHELAFSKWKILIGPNDWEDHASGKDGVGRYRNHNLPAASACPGLYELGVASISVNEGRILRKMDFENAIVVYLGQADNVRARLQEYGRTGSHLEHGNFASNCQKDYERPLHGGPGLFTDIFSKGYSNVFRWAPMKNKVEAKKAEIRLLQVFDYAWNRKGNGECRHADILAKLQYDSHLRWLKQLKQRVFSKRVGISIDAIVPLSEMVAPPCGFKDSLLAQIFKLSSSQVQFDPQEKSVCGVATGQGSICVNQPQPGRKRCAKHKGKKITETKESDSIKGRRDTSDFLNEMCSPSQQCRSDMSQKTLHYREDKSGVCGVVYDNGSVCRRLVKGKRIIAAKLSTDKIYISKQSSTICGVINGDGHACSRMPVPGRKRCEEHRGRRLVAAANINVSRKE